VDASDAARPHRGPERADATGLTRPLAAGSLASIVAFRHHPGRAHRDPSEERFDEPTVIFTTGGRWTIQSANEHVDATPRTVVFGGRGHEYRVRHDTAFPSDTALCVVLSPESLPANGAGMGQAFGTSLAVPRTAAVARIQAALVREAAAALPAGGLMIDGLAMELLAELARADASGDPPAPIGTGDGIRDRVGAARAYLDDHLAEDVDLATLGRLVALSPFHLARCFRREFGLGPHAYLADARLERAAQLLATTRLPVASIAHRVGWRSPSHFAGRFRKRFGMPPGAYRRLAGGT
jgi:AraC-like DNA-binding protein